MKKYLIPFVMSVFGLAIFAGCDLSGTQEQIEDPAEELSYKLSTNEASLRVVEYAVEDSDCITHFSKFKEGRDEVGYSITFEIHGTILIFDGIEGSVFKRVYETETSVCFVLADKTTHEIQKTVRTPDTGNNKVSGLDVVFDVDQGAVMVPDVMYRVNYKIEGGDENTIVRVLPMSDYINTYAHPETSTSGYFYVNIEPYFDRYSNSYRDNTYYDGVTEEDLYHSELAVMVSVTDGKNNSVVKTLNIQEGIIYSSYDTYYVGTQAGTVTVPVMTNVDYSVDVWADWLTYTPASKADLREDELIFSFTTNEDYYPRSAYVGLVDQNGYLLTEFMVYQEGTYVEYCPDCGHYPCECPEYVNPITIDGDFSDWDYVDYNYYVSTAECAYDAKYTGLRKVKVFTDEYYIHIYLELSEELVYNNSNVVFDLHLNSDGDTRYGDNYFAGQSAVDFLLEDYIISDSYYKSYDPAIWAYYGSKDEFEWMWESHMESGCGIAYGCGNHTRYEISILKEMLMGIYLADEFSLGFEIYDNYWNTAGLLPNSDVTDYNPNGIAEFLYVYNYGW